MPQGPFQMDESRPFAQRSDTMSLDIVQPRDVPRGKVMFVKDEDRSLKTEDLDNARPEYRHLRYLNKPDLSVGCTEPEHAGARANSYYPSMDRRVRDLSLTTADIEYAQPKSDKFKGNRHTDPVCPRYELPSCPKREPTPPRFNGRHTHDISDIEMSCPKVLHPQRNYTRNPNEADDIEYTVPNYKEKVARQVSSTRADRSLNVKDISEPRRRKPRDTNPLDPTYKVSTNRTTSLHTSFAEERAMGRATAPAEADAVGEIHGSKPRKLQWDNGEPQLSLLREDIAGTVPQRWVGSVPHNIYDPPEARPMVSFHDPHDIPGAQVGSLRKGIQGTRRCVNPLNPRYSMLDGDSKPHATPVMEAERGGATRPLHPLVQSRAAASSLPTLGFGAEGSAAPTPGGRAQQSGRSLRRDASDGGLRRGPRVEAAGGGAMSGGSRRSSRTPSDYGTPLPYQAGDPSRTMPVGGTLPFSTCQSDGMQSGGMSRRSDESWYG